MTTSHKKAGLIGFILGLLVLLVIAATPSFTDFSTNQFDTTASSVKVKAGATLTNSIFYGQIIFGTNGTADVSAFGINGGLHVGATNAVGASNIVSEANIQSPQFTGVGTNGGSLLLSAPSVGANLGGIVNNGGGYSMDFTMGNGGKFVVDTNAHIYSLDEQGTTFSNWDNGFLGIDGTNGQWFHVNNGQVSASQGFGPGNGDSLSFSTVATNGETQPFRFNNTVTISNAVTGWMVFYDSTGTNAIYSIGPGGVTNWNGNMYKTNTVNGSITLIDTNGTITTTGSITASNYYGDGSHLTGIASGAATNAIANTNGFGYGLTTLDNVTATNVTVGNATASRVAMLNAHKDITNATATGATGINADGTATTFAQVNALAPSAILTNGTTVNVVLSGASNDITGDLGIQGTAFVGTFAPTNITGTVDSTVAGPMITTNGSGGARFSYNAGSLTNANATNLVSGGFIAGQLIGNNGSSVGYSISGANSNAGAFSVNGTTTGRPSFLLQGNDSGTDPIFKILDGNNLTQFIMANDGSSTFSHPVTTTSSSSNSPSTLEFATAGWIRNLFAGSGVSYYTTTNVNSSFTNNDMSNGTNFEFSLTIPPYNRRIYTAPGAGTYTGSVVVTNKILQLNPGVTVDAYMENSGGTGAKTLTIHPEIYISYDGTNWQGDWSAASQNIIDSQTNLYQWVISNPLYVTTNATGFYVQRRFKVDANTSSCNLTTHMGTNKPSHITLVASTSASGNAFLPANQTFTGSNTFTGVTVINGAGTAATVVNLGLDANNNVVTNASPVGGGGGGAPDISTFVQTFVGFEDFLNANGAIASGKPSGVLGLQYSTIGAGGTLNKGGDTNAPGIFEIGTSTTPNTGVQVYNGSGTAGNNPFLIRGVWTNEWRFRLGYTNNPGTVDQNYQFYIGLGDTIGSAQPNSGVYLMSTSNDTHFAYVAATGNTYTTNLTTLVANTNVWYKFRVVMTATASLTNAVCTIDGSQSHTFPNTSTLPANNKVGLIATLNKVDGGTATVVDLDYCYLGYKLETSR